MSAPLGSLVEPGAKRAIDAAAGEAGKLLLMVRGFQTDQEAVLLMHLLWYAHDHGVEVIFVPTDRKEQA